MSGVIMEDGQQWERCNECGTFVKIQCLYYEEPSQAHTVGRDLCKVCATYDGEREEVTQYRNK